MMLMPDKKKMVSVILAGLARPESPHRKGKAFEFPSEKTEGVEEDHSIALRDAMEKFLKAVESKDVDSMVDYLKDFVYMCSEDHEPMVEELG